MSVSGVSSASSTYTYQAATAKQPVQQKTAPDGDSPAVEAAETRAAKMAEKANGGFAPKATNSTSAPKPTKGIDIMA